MDTIYATRVFFSISSAEYYFLKTHSLINSSKSMWAMRARITEKIVIIARNNYF
jgi:hypothetical protein